MDQRSTRRTTLTLPSECLDRAERLSKQRRQTLSAVVADALLRGLEEQEQMERSEAILKSYETAFAGFSDVEMALLDGVVLTASPEKPKRRK